MATHRILLKLTQHFVSEHIRFESLHRSQNNVGVRIDPSCGDLT
ncbi:unnamed protein product, partial [Rotaria magnacalcarata]